MSEVNIQQILASRYRTSAAAEKLTNLMMGNWGLSTKASVARLAISRSLALGKFSDGENVDSKGMDIPATSLFSKQDIGVWVGLIVTHGREYKSEIANQENFRAAVRMHWHRGINSLAKDWDDCDRNYDKFIETMANRRAELPFEATSNSGGIKDSDQTEEKPQDVSMLLLKALSDIGVSAQIKSFTHGPRITRYKVFLADVNHLDKLKKGLERLSLALNLKNALPSLSHGDESNTVFLDLPRPKSSWKNTGIHDLVNWARSTVSTHDQLPLFPGVDVMGKAIQIDLATAPHLLVGGATGMGKSVCLHALILSLLLRHDPSNLQLLLIDPKQVEFAAYQDSKYLYGGEIATTSTAAKEKLLEMVAEMEARYQHFANLGVANINEARATGEKIPSIAVFIEELADLLMQDKDIEPYIERLAQKARAAGIHLVLATQRPDAKTFSGLIRSNVPGRIALTVQKSNESTIILDDTGAERLLGAGDMLIKLAGGMPERVHGVYIGRRDLDSALRMINMSNR